ncbi:Uncharacterised protein [Vibrio cholerae]|nr:Uncharacterised protein [Vibrio cholerae]
MATTTLRPVSWSRPSATSWFTSLSSTNPLLTVTTLKRIAVSKESRMWRAESLSSTTNTRLSARPCTGWEISRILASCRPHTTENSKVEPLPSSL